MSWRSGSWPGTTPPLCERCWFPVAARDAIIYPIRPPGAEVVDDDEYGFAHPGNACTPQQPGAGHTPSDASPHDTTDHDPRDGTGR